MELQEQVSSVILKPESEILEYKAVLPPSKSIAQIICSFANTSGGLLILGVSEIGGRKVSGLSEDFRATSITHKAIDLLSPKPTVDYGYVQYDGKKLFAIKVEKASTVISLEGKIYIRENDRVLQSNPTVNTFQPGGYEEISALSTILETLKLNATDSKFKLLEHYQSILKMIDNLKALLYPDSPAVFTTVKEGSILSRILFSSVVDNFETYLSDILFEIYLAKPQSLKSEQMVKVEDVLNCADIQEFITFWAKEKIGKLQKGSVKGFIADNKQIKDLNAIDSTTQNEIEKILQIRHLYSHRNGIVDEKFLKYFPSGYPNGSEHQMSIEEVLNKIEYLSGIVNNIDNAAMVKYSLSTFL
ncbi:helix-turn-helix domain-containing protein [Chryseobacterium sp. YR221]|uniref:AlbA family DNA-binding domain-containing protein n=1 Tax=Chryseobacterium sp. YR221 TaxID=1500293 RepID=UPI0009D7EE47|nr:ATP-binding protein [Chryseobacterium sp. YR221]SMC40560.1 Putative DNA-binding domain-containing protein [Chryseobacterium sp. YR221]